MEVPFISSGAMSRAQYALVRKIENATTPQLADQLLLAEVDLIRDQLAQPTLTLRQAKECLILLLYCVMTLSPGLTVDLDFALPHAINLAEAGAAVKDKRIGYLFCAEEMSPTHELQLMLVNTLRKDLESSEVPRICLALDTLIQFSSEDAIPAIRTRLTDLISHNSPHVRRRALLVFHKLRDYTPDIGKDVAEKARKRLSDHDHTVVSAGLTLYADLARDEQISLEKFHAVLSTLLKASSHTPADPSNPWLLVKVLDLFRLVQANQDDLQIVADIIRTASRRGERGQMLLYQSFLALSTTNPDSIAATEAATGINLVNTIRHLLTTGDPNDVYVFLSCLERIDIRLWAGTTPEIPAVLEEWEVERIMTFVDSGDVSIRRKILRILNQVDPSILQALYTQLLQTGTVSSSHDVEESTKRLLEINEVISEGHGELYAQHLKNILHGMEGEGPLDHRQVLEQAVETVLMRMRTADFSFRSGVIGALFANLVEEGLHIGPTLMVILCALITEYLDNSPVSPASLLQGIARRVPSFAASIKDACLLAMIRVAADCEEVPSDVLDGVKTLRDQSGRHIRRRCDQFIALSSSKTNLKQIVSSAKSSTLPDLLAAVETYQASKTMSDPVSPPLNPTRSPKSPSRASPTLHKLRYDAYEAPVPRPSLRRLSNSSSRRSDIGSPRLSAKGFTGDDPLSRTMTPGDLALAAGLPLPRSPRVRVSDPQSSNVKAQSTPHAANVSLFHTPSPTGGHTMPSIDLISLDSPFISEPPAAASVASSVTEPDFENIWNSMESSNARGWCENSIDTVVRQLQSLSRPLRVIAADRAPFEGELKIIISPEGSNSDGLDAAAVLRLKESEDQSCLWRLRCDDEVLMGSIRALLA